LRIGNIILELSPITTVKDNECSFNLYDFFTLVSAVTDRPGGVEVTPLPYYRYEAYGLPIASMFCHNGLDSGPTSKFRYGLYYPSAKYLPGRLKFLCQI